MQNEAMLLSDTPQDRDARPMERCEVQNEPRQVGILVDANKIRQITIAEVSRGYIVHIGCATFAISTKAELITKLTEYINDPEKTETKWHKNELF